MCIGNRRTIVGQAVNVRKVQPDVFGDPFHICLKPLLAGFQPVIQTRVACRVAHDS